MAQKPTIPKGTRDFGPAEMVRRNYIFDTIKQVFRLYGYQPIETPAMENLSTLMGKYGEEGDKLLFKILNSGDYLSQVTGEPLNAMNSNRFTSLISEKGLRYDLTVPTARFVVQHQAEIIFPFKRYQIQPVWRADRPQKGRYREFYQCDVDVIGSDSLLNEAELCQIIRDVFKRLNIRIQIRINNRKLLAGIAEYIGEPDRITDITIAIDKLEKAGMEAVEAELSGKGVSLDSIGKLRPVLQLTGNRISKLERLKELLAGSETGKKGIEEINVLFDYLEALDLSSMTELDLTLARGLNYYTGAIFEVKAMDFEIGSICGGGRYDDLTGIFGLPGVSGVGISFGAERIYDVLGGLALFPSESVETTKVLLINFGSEEEKYCLSVLSRLRESGINAEIFPEPAKMKKQMGYADARKIPFVALAGSNEIAGNQITLKDLSTGFQQLISVDEMIKILLS